MTRGILSYKRHGTHVDLTEYVRCGIPSFCLCLQPSGRTIWTADGQAWAVTGAPEKYNLVSYEWNDATSQFDRAFEMLVDPVGTATISINTLHGRYETITDVTDGSTTDRWVLYSVQNARLIRIIPSLTTVATIATAPTNNYCERRAL